jgi:hypothetical protein
VRAHVYDYCVIRLVPRVEREEFVNVGVMVSCPRGRFLVAGIELDEALVRALAPGLDLDPVRRQLASIPLICAGGPDAGPIGRLGMRERFHWLASTRSTIIQMSPVHSGRCDDPDRIVDHLMDRMVRRRAARANGID